MRISVTDRCNFRCRYCVPQAEFEHIDCEEVLRYEEMLFAVKAAVSLGVERIRVTGGEPLVRKDLPYFLSQLTALEGIKEVTLTTNGTLLLNQGEDIYKAGVRRLNISLDTLRDDRYRYVTGGFGIENTLKAIEFSQKIGFSPLKVNSVVIKEFNDDEILDFCEYAANKNINVRFIEFMPIGNSPDWKKENIMTGAEILEKIKTRYDVIALPQSPNAGPARNYKLSNGAVMGIITPMSEHFCNTCDKIRLTSDGKLRPCLLSDKEISVVEAIKAKDNEALLQLFAKSLGLKELEHSAGIDNHDPFKRTMSKIGG